MPTIDIWLCRTVAVAMAALTIPTAGRAIAAGTPRDKSGYALVHGLKMYYEIHGAADGKEPPLVLLHGGGSTIETSFAKVLPLLATGRQVIAFEQQGHGRTADIADRPFSFEQSADDAAALLRHLKIEKADFFGYSNGGNIALQIAIRHPSQVRRLVVASAMFKHAVRMFRLLPHGRLAVLPDTDHMAIMQRADGLVSMIEAFLDAPMPGAVKPEERRRTRGNLGSGAIHQRLHR